MSSGVQSTLKSQVANKLCEYYYKVLTKKWGMVCRVHKDVCGTTLVVICCIEVNCVNMGSCVQGRMKSHT